MGKINKSNNISQYTKPNRQVDRRQHLMIAILVSNLIIIALLTYSISR